MRASIRKQLRSSFGHDDNPRSRATPAAVSATSSQGSLGQFKFNSIFQQNAGSSGSPVERASTSSSQGKPTDPAIVKNVHKLGVTDLSGVLAVLRREFDKVVPTEDRSMKFERIAQVKTRLPRVVVERLTPRRSLQPCPTAHLDRS